MAIFFAWQFRDDAVVTTEEVLRDDEHAQSQRAVDNFIQIIDQTASTYAARGAHAKGHACVKALFNVEEQLEPKLQHGVFANAGRRYRAWIRFSNAASDYKASDDRKRDTRGMAIKIIDFAAAKNAWLDDSVSTQDFLMHSNPVFFSANIADYNKLVESDNKILSFFDSANPFSWRLRELSHALDTLAPPPLSPLIEDYFSNTAYRLGPHNIKFSAQTCASKNQTSEIPADDPNFLRHALVQHLKSDAGCFHFLVQLQIPDKYMPIEDPSVEWKTDDSPWHRVATIEIPIQDAEEDAQTAFCENLSFSPWNALKVHRPIGQLNRIRKQVYEASAAHRHRKNQATAPSGFCVVKCLA